MKKTACCHCGRACDGEWRCNDCDHRALCQRCAAEAGLLGEAAMNAAWAQWAFDLKKSKKYAYRSSGT